MKSLIFSAIVIIAFACTNVEKYYFVYADGEWVQVEEDPRPDNSLDNKDAEIIVENSDNENTAVSDEEENDDLVDFDDADREGENDDDFLMPNYCENVEVIEGNWYLEKTNGNEQPLMVETLNTDSSCQISISGESFVGNQTFSGTIFPLVINTTSYDISLDYDVENIILNITLTWKDGTGEVDSKNYFRH